MNIPNEILLSDFLKHRVLCDSGLDHGIGIYGWMHPPVHRILGWVTSPSSLKVERQVWRLDQLRAITNKQIYVKGQPEISDQLLLNRLPTLLDSELVNINGDKIGVVADFIFNSKNGAILNYLISRSDPRLPGTSRWKLSISQINEFFPGAVSVNVSSLDELPIVRSSLKQDLFKKSRLLRDQFYDMSNRATEKLEGWLEEVPWDDSNRRRFRNTIDDDPLDNWNISDSETSLKDLSSRNEVSDEDPWI